MLVLAAWRLSSGPITLAFLSPYIERALSAEDGSLAIRLDDTILTWAGWERTLDVRVLNVRAVGAGGTAVAVVPELSLSLSVKALLKGIVAPRSIELYRPSLQVTRREDGTLEVGFGQGAEASDVLSSRLLARLSAEPDEVGPMGYLSRIVVRDADLMIVDRRLDTLWRAPHAEVSLRRDADGVEGEISLDLESDERVTRVVLLGGYRRSTDRLDFGVRFSDLVPATFARLSPQFAALEGAAVPLSGRLLVSMKMDGGVEAVDFEMKGGAGQIDLPAPLAQSVEVAGLTVNGLYRGADQVLTVDNLTVDLGEGGSLLMPAADGHRAPLRSLTARLNLAEGGNHLEVVSVEADLGGPTATLTADIRRDGGETRIRAEGTLQEVPADDVGRYWPAAWGKDAHTWVTANMSAGRVAEARVNVEAVVRGGDDVAITHLSGDMRLVGMTVDYLSPMPKAIRVDGTATFNRHRFDIAVSRGEAFGLTSSEGHLTFTGLDEYDQYLEVDLAIQGPAKRAIQLIDHKPLGLASKINIDPNQSSGDAKARLKLKFILEHDLTIDQVTVSATARLRKLSVANAILGRSISNGDLNLRLDNRSMVVSGKAHLGTIPGTLEWRRNFDDKAPVQALYVLKGTVDDKQREEEFGLTFAPFSPEFIHGPIGADVRWEILASGQGRMKTKLDLSQASLALPEAGWSKPAGGAGSAEVDLILQGERITGIPSFTVAARDLKVRGSVAIDEASGRLERVDLAELAFGRTDLKGAIVAGADGGWTVSAHGASFDLEPVIDDLFSDKSALKETEGKPNLSVAVDLDQVWIGPGQAIRQVRGTLARAGGKWRAVTLASVLVGDRTLTVRIEPGKDGNRNLTVVSNDAGETLRTFGYYENMVGGNLDIRGTFDDAAPGAPLTGRLTATDFRVIKAPVLAHLVSYVALTGIVDALQGPGLSFSDLDIPFTQHEGVITLKDGRVHGSALGFTASGKIFTYAEVLDVEGTLVPAYAVNSALGNIPFIGGLFSGGEKGGGVFAATYKMTGPIEKPKVTVNPLSVLAPGFLRKLFGIFDGADTPPPVPPAEPAPRLLAPR
jgi:hypothetical protein